MHPLALEVLAGNGFDSAQLRSKSWDDLAHAPALELAFTVCDVAANEACPVWPGQPITAQWGLSDPAAVSGSLAERRWAFRRAYGTSLSVESLSRLALQQRVAEIGRA